MENHKITLHVPGGLCSYHTNVCACDTFSVACVFSLLEGGGVYSRCEA